MSAYSKTPPELKGKITRNPFLNFLREFRTQFKGCPATEVSVKGAKLWANMNEQKKEKYYRQSQHAPPFKKRSKKYHNLEPYVKKEEQIQGAKEQQSKE